MNPTTPEDTDRMCWVCLSPYVQSHHIVFGKKGKARWDASWNRMDLCDHHHNDHREGVHHNKHLKRKTLLFQQGRLFKWLPPEWVKERPDWISETDWWQITKLIPCHDQGYRTEDVARRMMGGKLV